MFEVDTFEVSFQRFKRFEEEKRLRRQRLMIKRFIVGFSE